MGQAKSMQGGDKDPILRPRPAPLPSLVCNIITYRAMLTGMTISTRFIDNSPGPTLIGRVLLDPIKNRFRFGFKKKKPKAGLIFHKNSA